MERTRRLWSRIGNPPNWVARRLGITHQQLSTALHRIKRDAGLSPPDHVSIYEDGSVTDDGDEWIGNIHDEL
jgi:hypothetical protein